MKSASLNTTAWKVDNLRAVFPASRREPRFSTEVIQHFFAVPSLFCGDLGKEDRRTSLFNEHNTVPPDDYLPRRRTPLSRA